MPIIAKSCSCQASRSKEAISSLQGPHQLAHTLINSGRPPKELKCRGGPFSPCSVESGRIAPMGTSPGGFAADGFARAMQSKRVQRHRSNGLLCAFIGALSYLAETDDFAVISAGSDRKTSGSRRH